jgi:dTDP-4-dehydrorhamnose 3,5-epimerase
MNTRTSNIDGLLIIEPKVFEDERGYFYESYNEKSFQNSGITQRFVQDNQSKSSYGVVRGLHMQTAPHAQTKLIRVLEGTIYDVAVDVRPGSPTFGMWFGLEISAENRIQLLIPKGCCHGFSVLSSTATVLYKCDDFYFPETETGIRFNDPELQIDWKIPHDKIVVSEKDKLLPLFRDFKNI